MPAQKARSPDPVRTSTRVHGSFSASTMAAPSSRTIGAVRALRASGRFRRTTATGPCWSRTSSAIAAPVSGAAWARSDAGMDASWCGRPWRAGSSFVGSEGRQLGEAPRPEDLLAQLVGQRPRPAEQLVEDDRPPHVAVEPVVGGEADARQHLLAVPGGRAGPAPGE